MGIQLTHVEDVLILLLIDVGSVVPNTGDTDILNLLAGQLLSDQLNSLVADAVGVLSNGANQLSVGLAVVLHPVVLVGQVPFLLEDRTDKF